MPTRISYDGMSRLTAAGYLENGKRNDHFSTSYKYDLMGNILSLRREGLLNSGNYGTIDDLTYSYKGNQLVKIDDAAEESPSYRGAMHFRDYADEETEYTYDANGNMLTDSNKGITSIDYNVLDLPQCISTKSRVLFKENSNDTIYYTYSADGTKLCSTYKEAKSRILSYNPKASLTSLNVGTVGIAKPIVKRLKTKYYYCSNLVYDNDNISAILFDGGYASMDDDNGIVMHFYVKDHLGSNRLVVDGNGNIEEVNHYYPFGALMGDRCGVSRNNYKYIGKELDTMYGWNMQDHEARWYDPVVGRWMVTDPLQEKYASVSSYCYTNNNPIVYYDSNGKDAILIVYPDYPINIYNTPEINIPFIGKIPQQKININVVGHAGVLLINNKTGVTHYYEYGRYDTTDGTVGCVRKVEVSNVTIGKDGKPTINSLNKFLGYLSKNAGHGGRIDGAYIISNEFEKMNNYANSKFMESNPSDGNAFYNKNRRPYSIIRNNCGTFAVDVINQDKSVDAPYIINPTPVNIVDEYQEEGNAVVRYNPSNDTTTIGKGDEYDAKNY